MKELVTIEFRYHDKPNNQGVGECKSKTITIGIYDTLEEAVKEGNKAIQKLAEKGFQVRSDDHFKIHGLFGYPNRLVSNCCYSTKGVQYFAKITKLEFDDIFKVIDNCFKSHIRWLEYKKKSL